MNAFEFSRALLTFFEVLHEEAISAEDKLALYRDMLAAVPAELSLPPYSRASRKVLFDTLESAIRDHARSSVKAEAQKPQPEAPRKDAPKPRHAARK